MAGDKGHEPESNRIKGHIPGFVLLLASLEAIFSLSFSSFASALRRFQGQVA